MLSALFASLAAVAIAALAWDGWRRRINADVSRETDVSKRLTALEDTVGTFETRMERNEDVIRHGIAEARGLVAPIRSEILSARQKARGG